MINFQERIIRGADIFKKSILLFLAICLISSLLSVYGAPFLVTGSMSEQEINQGLSQVSNMYGGALTFSANEIISSLVYMFRLCIISTMLLIVAYVVKQKIDKRIFKISKWRDWRFFIYISGISLVLVNIFQSLIANNGDNFLINLGLTILSSFVIVIISSVLLPEELERIKIQDMQEIFSTYQVGIKGMIFNSDRKVLVVLKKKIQKWDIPGGRTAEGETILQTLDRELKEEILNLKEYKVIRAFNASKIEDANLVLIYYKIEADLKEIELSEEHETYRWISYEDIDNLEKEYPIDSGIKEALKISFNS